MPPALPSRRPAMGRLTSTLFGLAAFALAAGCEKGGSLQLGPALKDAGPVQIQNLSWNAKSIPVGAVAAAADLYDDNVIFSDLGALVFTSGVLLATDANYKGWQSAAVIPAGDLSGQWLVGVDDGGRVLRLKNRSALEDVSDRYGLVGKRTREAVSLGKDSLTAFALDGEVAIADGQKVSRYSLDLTGLTGAGGRLAGLTADGAVRVLDRSQPERPPLEYRLPNEKPVAVALDATARLLIATENRLYAESQGPGSDLTLLLDVSASPDLEGTGENSHIQSLLASGVAVYLAVDRLVIEIVGDQLRRSQPGLVPSDAKLLPASSGQFYALSPSQGALLRLGVEAQGGPSELEWQRSVLPIFSRLCSLCHLPGGSASIDLSTFQSWDTRRMLMDQRVLQGKPSPMPPAGAGTLTAEEQAALRAWLALSSGM